jgi:intracellular sulfur oxidation DsrE/DsrF family protein
MRSNFVIPALIVGSIVASLSGAALAEPAQTKLTSGLSAGVKSAHATAGMKAKKPTGAKSVPATATPKLATIAKPHRLAIQVDQNDPAVMNLALNNATNIIQYYREKGEVVDVDVITYGPGLHMLRADTSPVQDRIKALKNLAFPSKVQFSACNNTKEGMEKKEGHAIEILPEAVIVPSGVVRLMELQGKGWSYLRP